MICLLSMLLIQHKSLFNPAFLHWTINVDEQKIISLTPYHIMNKSHVVIFSIDRRLFWWGNCVFQIRKQKIKEKEI